MAGGSFTVHESNDAAGGDDAEVFTQDYWDQKYAGHTRGPGPGAPTSDWSNSRPTCRRGRRWTWAVARAPTWCGWPSAAGASPGPTSRRSRSSGPASTPGRPGSPTGPSWLHVDLVAGATALPSADLVTAMFLHVPEAGFDRVYTAIAAAVRPGGTLLVCGHHPAERESDLRSPHLGHLLFPPERVTSVLDSGWQIEVAEARTREVVKDGASAVATDTVVLAKRKPV